jgi:hypothetical protein
MTLTNFIDFVAGLPTVAHLVFWLFALRQLIKVVRESMALVREGVETQNVIKDWRERRPTSD